MRLRERFCRDHVILEGPNATIISLFQLQMEIVSLLPSRFFYFGKHSYE